MPEQPEKSSWVTIGGERFEITAEDVQQILERAGCAMNEPEILEACYALVVERLLDEAVAQGQLDGWLEDGEKVYRKKLTRLEKIQRAVTLRMDGYRMADIARDLRVDPATASMFLFEARRRDLIYVKPARLQEWREAARG